MQPVASQQDDWEHRQELQVPLSSLRNAARWSVALRKASRYSGPRIDEMRPLTGAKELVKIRRATKDKGHRLTW
jgi:hypothetical protein